MPIWKAVLLGIVQGMAEFLPISSSGHLIIIKEILGVDLAGGGILFDVMLHVGTLFAIVIAFWKDIKKIVQEGLHILCDLTYNAGVFIGKRFRTNGSYRKIVKSSYRKMVVMLLVSTIPTGVIGYVLSDVVSAVNSVLLIPGICLVITSLFLVIADIADAGHKRPREASYIDATAIGIAQGLATMPGISRSGTTIVACLLCGFEKKFAVKYSFIMSIPAVIGAGILESRNIAKMNINTDLVISCGIATVVAAIVGYLSICMMVHFVTKRKYKIFSIYCVLVGSLAIVYYFK